MEAIDPSGYEADALAASVAIVPLSPANEQVETAETAKTSPVARENQSPRRLAERERDDRSYRPRNAPTPQTFVRHRNRHLPDQRDEYRERDPRYQNARRNMSWRRSPSPRNRPHPPHVHHHQHAQQQQQRPHQEHARNEYRPSSSHRRSRSRSPRRVSSQVNIPPATVAAHNTPNSRPAGVSSGEQAPAPKQSDSASSKAPAHEEPAPADPFPDTEVISLAEWKAHNSSPYYRAHPQLRYTVHRFDVPTGHRLMSQRRDEYGQSRWVTIEGVTGMVPYVHILNPRYRLDRNELRDFLQHITTFRINEKARTLTKHFFEDVCDLYQHQLELNQTLSALEIHQQLFSAFRTELYKLSGGV